MLNVCHRLRIGVAVHDNRVARGASCRACVKPPAELNPVSHRYDPLVVTVAAWRFAGHEAAGGCVSGGPADSAAQGSARTPLRTPAASSRSQDRRSLPCRWDRERLE